MQHMVQMGLQEKCKTKVIQRDQIPKYIVVEEHMAIHLLSPFIVAHMFEIICLLLRLGALTNCSLVRINKNEDKHEDKRLGREAEDKEEDTMEKAEKRDEEGHLVRKTDEKCILKSWRSS